MGYMKQQNIWNCFLRNLLLDEKNELHNRTMHISGQFKQIEKVNIDERKVDIESAKVDIETKLPANVSEKTINHAVSLYLKHDKSKIFGRTVVEEITGLKPSGASKLIKLLLDNEVVASVSGYGKGKCCFR